MIASGTIIHAKRRMTEGATRCDPARRLLCRHRFLTLPRDNRTSLFDAELQFRRSTPCSFGALAASLARVTPLTAWTPGRFSPLLGRPRRGRDGRGASRRAPPASRRGVQPAVISCSRPSSSRPPCSPGLWQARRRRSSNGERRREVLTDVIRDALKLGVRHKLRACVGSRSPSGAAGQPTRSTSSVSCANGTAFR